jgi:hypothetical protein
MKRNNTQNVVRSGMFLALAIAIQLIGKFAPGLSQYVVGPGINAVLLMAAFACGTGWGIAIGILTPITAWLVGQLAQALAPFIPFIIIGNVIFIMFFGILRRYKKWGIYVGWIAGAVCKFLFLYLAATKLINVFGIVLPGKLVKVLAVSMGIPQLITALVGGFVAIIIIKTILVKVLNLGGKNE